MSLEIEFVGDRDEVMLGTRTGAADHARAEFALAVQCAVDQLIEFYSACGQGEGDRSRCKVAFTRLPARAKKSLNSVFRLPSSYLVTCLSSKN